MLTLALSVLSFSAAQAHAENIEGIWRPVSRFCSGEQTESAEDLIGQSLVIAPGTLSFIGTADSQEQIGGRTVSVQTITTVKFAVIVGTADTLSTMQVDHRVQRIVDGQAEAAKTFEHLTDNRLRLGFRVESEKLHLKAPADIDCDEGATTVYARVKKAKKAL